MPNDDKTALGDADSADEQMDVIAMGEDESLTGKDSTKHSADIKKAPESSQDTGDSVQSQDEKQDEKQAEDKKQGDTSDKPAETEKSPEPVDEVDLFLNEMTELKEQSKDKFEARVSELKDKDPVKYRLWDSHNRVTGLQKGYQTERQKRLELERTREEQERASRKKELDGFEKLSSEEEEALKIRDPDAYVDYKLEEKEINQKKEKFEEDEKGYSDRKQLSELNEFVFKTFGFEVNQENAERVAEVLPQAVAQKLEQKLEKVFGKKEYYTVDQIELVYDSVTRDDAVYKAKISARRQMADSLDGVHKFGTSKLDRAQNPNKGASRRRKPEDVPLEEIHSMGEEEFDSFDSAG